MGACPLFQEALQVAPNTSFSPLSSFTILYKPRAVVPHGEVFSLLFCLACEGGHCTVFSAFTPKTGI